MPTSKMPTTVNCFRRGIMPAGVTRPCGAISATLSPMRTPQRARELGAEHDAELAGLAAPSSAAGAHVAADVGDLLLALGQDAAHHAAAHRLAARRAAPAR